jgi:hypothetical protein
MIHFPRKILADSLIRDLSGASPLSDAPNGLFLAAPRRTGKSMFLQHDLVPELVAKGIIPIYVDLWEHRAEDPGTLIAYVIGRRASEERTLLQKVKDSVHGKVTVGPLALDFEDRLIGKPGGVSIPEALRKIHDATGKVVCLIIDEAQHALTTQEGINAMASLKSARDQMNTPGDVSLMLVMSGSDRDKLLRLVNSNAAPFFGSHITRMPTLGHDYVEALADELNRNHEKTKPVDVDVLARAFESYGFRPQFLGAGILAALDETQEGITFNRALEQHATNAAADANDEMQSVYLGCSDIQRAVLWRMLEEGGKYRPFDAAALKFYTETMGKDVTATQVQAALDGLRTRDDPIVWKSARGEYSVEDSSMLRWFKSLQKAGKWPPTA